MLAALMLSAAFNAQAERLKARNGLTDEEQKTALEKANRLR